MGTSVESPAVESALISAASRLSSEQAQVKLKRLNELTSRSEILRPCDKDKIMQEQKLLITKLVEDEKREQLGCYDPNPQNVEQVMDIGEM